MLIKYITHIAVISALLFSNLEAVVRAAVDVGSGGLKVTVADVDPDSQTIKELLYSKERALHLKRDMVTSGKSQFSQEIQDEAIELLSNFQQETSIYAPEEWSGIATAAARQSENSQELFDRVQQELGINITIIPQEEEGRIGFNTAMAVSGVEESTLIAYDSGGGSFQLTTQLDGKLEVTEGKIGIVSAIDILTKEIRKEAEFSSRPISYDEAKELHRKLRFQMPKMSSAFAAKLKKPTTKVVGIGNENFIFAHGATATGKNSFTKEELWESIKGHCHLNEQQLKKLDQPNQGAIVGMILLYTVMDTFNIGELTYNYANGCCEGVLTDPTYWITNTA